MFFILGSVKNFVALVKNQTNFCSNYRYDNSYRKVYYGSSKGQSDELYRNNITSVADVYSCKDSFKDILQELLEAEMDATLGYEKL